MLQKIWMVSSSSVNEFKWARSIQEPRKEEWSPPMAAAGLLGPDLVVSHFYATTQYVHRARKWREIVSVRTLNVFGRVSINGLNLRKNAELHGTRCIVTQPWDINTCRNLLENIASPLLFIGRIIYCFWNLPPKGLHLFWHVYLSCPHPQPVWHDNSTADNQNIALLQWMTICI